MKRIKVPAEFIHILAKEFRTTTQNVYASLRYFNNSDLAISIRMRAKELLLEEANNVEEVLKTE